jgi:multidrug efflux system outer membrane protein
LIRRLLLAGATGIWLCGCAVGPDYKRPVVPVPPAFRGEGPDTGAPANGRSFGDLRWWEVFQDPELRGLIRIAVVNNYDVRIAAARILEARAQVGITRADQFPQMSAGGSAGRSRLSGNAFPPLPPTAREGNNFELSGSLSYEVDLWGRLRRESEAARAQLLASEEARATVLSTLVSDVATAYFQLRELDLELEITRRTLRSREASLRLVRLRRDRGVASGLDIRQAEAQLVAANANIGVAKALFFPQIALTASGGFQSAALSQLFEGPSGFWAFAGQLLQPVFQGGRIWFNFQASRARRQEALVVYEQAIHTAFREVSDALIAYRRTREFRADQEALTGSLRAYSRLSAIRYRGGVASYLEVLDAEARLFSSELELARARREELLAVVQLYKALGGGWQIEEAATATSSSEARKGPDE